MERGEIWWAELPEPDGSGPGGRRPVVVIQSDLFNRSAIRTVIIAVFTGRLDRAGAPGNMLVTPAQSGLGCGSLGTTVSVASGRLGGKSLAFLRLDRTWRGRI